MSTRRRSKHSAWLPWLLMGLVAVVAIPVNAIVKWLGIWDIPSGYGHHPWGVAIFAVLVPSVAIVLGGYERWSRRSQRRTGSG